MITDKVNYYQVTNVNKTGKTITVQSIGEETGLNTGITTITWRAKTKDFYPKEQPKLNYVNMRMTILSGHYVSRREVPLMW